MRLKTHSLVRNLAHLGQAENLISAAVGQDRSVPAHESVQTAEVTYQFVARTQVKMIGIAKQHLTTYLR